MEKKELFFFVITKEGHALNSFSNFIVELNFASSSDIINFLCSYLHFIVFFCFSSELASGAHYFSVSLPYIEVNLWSSCRFSICSLFVAFFSPISAAILEFRTISCCITDVLGVPAVVSRGMKLTFCVPRILKMGPVRRVFRWGQAKPLLTPVYMSW